jgi:beta-glucosidase
MSFPDSFIWGAAAASYQIEGNTKGYKGCLESVWDMSCRKDGFVKGKNDGSLACDHIHQYKQDVSIMKDMGLKAYRLSIMWPRVIPEGTGNINKEGLDFYDKLIDELLAAGIDPWVTLFHWDYPIELFYRGGWLNRESSDWFADYTKVIVDRFSDRVQHWFTLNEQACFIGLGHQAGEHAPGLQLPTKEVNRAWHNALISHGKAVQIIRSHSKTEPKVGAAPVFRTAIPASSSPEDLEAARRHTFDVIDTSMFNATWWLDPAFKGEYPEDGLALFGKDTPDILPGDMETICQPLDFLGFNCYQSGLVQAGPNGEVEGVEYPTDYPCNYFHWPVTPESLKYGSQFLHERYQKPIVVTENGLSLNDWVSVDGKVHDPKRIDFLTRYLRGLKEAIDDGVDVLGYFQWSILDNFEWAEGYYQRFGLVHVDYATQERTVKDSGHWFKELIQSHGEILGGGGPLENYTTPDDFFKGIRNN